MNIVDTVFTTHQLGKPAGWDDDAQGTCETLPAAFVNDLGAYASFWMPSAEDLAKLNAGQPIQLLVYGNAHPVVSVNMDHLVTKEHVTRVI